MGQNLAEGGPLVTVGGPIIQNSEKVEEMIVNLWMSCKSILDKKTKTPRKTHKINKLKNTKY